MAGAVKRWEELTPDEKKMFIRQVDVYAAYLAYTDHEIGRVIQAVEDIGKLDNTLVIYISGDNRQAPQGDHQGAAAHPDAGRGAASPARGAAQQQGERVARLVQEGWTPSIATRSSSRRTKQLASPAHGTQRGAT
jgi:arylsulfatase A-like enzyme